MQSTDCFLVQTKLWQFLV